MLFLAQEYATDFDSASSTARNLNFAVYLVRVEDPLLLQFHHHGTGYSPLHFASASSIRDREGGGLDTRTNTTNGRIDARFEARARALADVSQIVIQVPPDVRQNVTYDFNY